MCEVLWKALTHACNQVQSESDQSCVQHVCSLSKQVPNRKKQARKANNNNSKQNVHATSETQPCYIIAQLESKTVVLINPQEERVRGNETVHWWREKETKGFESRWHVGPSSVLIFF